MFKKALKIALKIVLILVIIIAIAGGYLYFRMHNNIENLLVSKDTWRSEVLEFPLIFAPDINFKGEEHIRFAPGWGEKESPEYFSYVFLWMVDESPSLNSSKLENLTNTYFDGLMKTGALTNFNLTKSIPETTSTFKETNDSAYVGKIKLYDEFFKKEYIQLNAKILTEYCLSNNQHLIWFYLSPQDEDHPIRNELYEIKLDNKCRQRQ